MNGVSFLSEYSEQRFKDGSIIRVNEVKETYIVIKNGTPLINPFGDGKSIINELPKVIFLGADFDLSMHNIGQVNFFPVAKGAIRIDFGLKTLSDVRHLGLQSPMQVDRLPCLIHHIPNVVASSVPRGFKGLPCFVVDSNVKKEVGIRLGALYPDSKVVIVGVEREIMIQQSVVQAKVSDADASHIVAADPQGDDYTELSSNPVFAARAYFRELDWKKLSSIPYDFKLEIEDVNSIVTSIKVMLRKADQKKDIKKNEQALRTVSDFYNLLSFYLSLDKDTVEFSLAGGGPPRAYIPALIKAIEAQINFRKPIENSVESEFFSFVLGELKSISVDN